MACQSLEFEKAPTAWLSGRAALPERGLARGGSAAGPPRGEALHLLLEILRIDPLEELPELLDLLLLVVADHDRRLGQDVLVGEDRHVHPDRQGDGVARAGGP